MMQDTSIFRFRVFTILSYQIWCTTIMINLIFLILKIEKEPSVYDLYHNHAGFVLIFIFSILIFLASYFSILYLDWAKFKTPINVFTLALMTLSLGYLHAIVFVFVVHQTNEVSVAGLTLVTIVVVVLIFLISDHMTWDLTEHTYFMMFLGWGSALVLFIVGFILYFIYDVQRILGKKKVNVTSEGIIYVNARLFVDITVLYINLLTFLALGYYIKKTYTSN